MCRSGHVRELSRLSAPVLRLLEYAQDWQCPSSAGSALGCLREFVRRAASEGLLSEDAVLVAGESCVDNCIPSPS